MNGGDRLVVQSAEQKKKDRHDIWPDANHRHGLNPVNSPRSTSMRP